MKYVIGLFLTAIVFSGCSSPAKKPPVASFSADSLMGNWIVVKIDVSGTNDQHIQLMESIVQPLKTTIELSTMSFRHAGILYADDGNARLNVGKWSLTTDSFRIIHPDFGSEDRPFIVTQLKSDSLKMQHTFTNDKEELTIHLVLKKLIIPDSTLNIFEPENNTWRISPKQPEDETAMRQRLKQMLAYYAAYFGIIQNNKIGYFNREKILVPLMFYDGGLGITPFEDAGNFPDLFYDEADAKKAHAILEKAFSNYKYPDLGNKFVQEYIVALREIAEKI